MAGGTNAYADDISFENNGEFEWSVCGQSVGLDVTLPAGAQDGRPGASSFEQLRACLDCDRGGAIRIDAPISGSLAIAACDERVVHRFFEERRIGEDLGRLEWRNTGPVYCGYYCYQTWSPPATGYIGIRFSAPDGFHYGWIKARTSNSDELYLEALAWGYETEPDTLIRAGDGTPPCSDNSSLRLTCKSGRSGPTLTASVKKVASGLFATLRIDGDPDTDEQTRANSKGKIKTKFKNVAPGEHTVELRQCGLSEKATCEP
jgi:hypothetical protein